MKAVVLIFTIYISVTLCQVNEFKNKNYTKKYRPYVNGKILIRSAKYEKSSIHDNSKQFKRNSQATKTYTAFQVVGKPKTIESVPDSPYFPVDRTDEPKSRIKKELADYPWSLFRQKRSAVLDVTPIVDDNKKIDPNTTEVQKIKETTPVQTTPVQTTPVPTTLTIPTPSTTKAVQYESTTKVTTTVRNTENIKRSNNANTAKSNGSVRKGRKSKQSRKVKKSVAGRAKPKDRQTKTVDNVRSKNSTTRIKKLSKKKSKNRKGNPQRSKKRTQSNKGKKSKSAKGRTRKNTKDTRRLIAGREALIEDYPYVVSIQKNREHWCSGALLNPRLVITTANCLWKATRISRMEVRAGSRHTNHGGQKVGIQEVMKHPRWGLRKNPDNDVALLLLDKNIKFSDSVHGIDLPNRVMMPPFDDAWITSWGSERRDGIYDPKFSNSLQVYHSRLINLEKCNNITMRFSVVVTENFICLAQSGRQAPCTRDTGAPAVSDGILWGLASWGLRKLCGTERFPAVFSYLASHTNMDFIANATRYFMSDKRQYPFADRYPINMERK